MLIEVPTSLAAKLGTRPEIHDWSGGEVSFGTGSDELSAVLQEVTAIINVPFLKTHNIAGVTGCLKNLSHALVRRPGRYHDQACAPYVGNIVALPQIRSKLRLNIVNAIRALFNGGPHVRPEGIWNHSALIISRDPVAADAVGLDIINDERAPTRPGQIGNKAGQIPHIHVAAGPRPGNRRSGLHRSSNTLRALTLSRSTVRAIGRVRAEGCVHPAGLATSGPQKHPSGAPSLERARHGVVPSPSRGEAG